VFAHIYLNSPDCKYENDDDGTCLLSFCRFNDNKGNSNYLKHAKKSMNLHGERVGFYYFSAV